MLEANLVRSFVFHDEQFSLITVLQFSNTGTDAPVVTKNASVGSEAVGDDVLLLDPDGHPTLVVNAVQLQTRLQSQLCLGRSSDALLLKQIPKNQTGFVLVINQNKPDFFFD